jgi:FMN-dependent NADH-azoreductase
MEAGASRRQRHHARSKRQPLPTIDAEWITAMQTPEEKRTPAQREALLLSDTLIAELKAADEYIFGVPMHNFTVPSVLRLWIDQVARAGKTFAYVNGAPQGCSKARRRTSSSLPAASTKRERRWLPTTSWSRTSARSSASSA